MPQLQEVFEAQSLKHVLFILYNLEVVTLLVSTKKIYRNFLSKPSGGDL